ncbi:hypothetical protein L1987_13326 [Smallanthus sonchifolius]|uniref:Uncharacterized protein n=1 Tax=Smallanthus sonchifolius TaxID=185202 RepID=A0ACB9JGL0_9ASTR|nr:hypothetical protein L1987_13326 [Smallanthus sonchifolius]
MPHEEEPEQVSESEPEEESEEEPVGDAKRANSDTDLGETVPYSIAYWEDTCSEEVRPPTPFPPRFPSPAPLRRDWVNFMGLARGGTARKTVLPPKKQALSSTNTESLPKMHCLLNQLEIGESSHQIRPQEHHGVVGLTNSALRRLHGRVVIGETRLTAVEHEVIAAEQRNEWAGERLDSFAALTIVNTMLLAFVLFRGWLS